MKNLTLTLAVLVTVIGTAFATGDETKDNRVTLLPGEDRYKLIYSEQGSNIVKIRVRDEDGNLLRTDRVKNEGGFMKPYSTEALEDGTYTFEITDKFGVIKKDIVISSPQDLQVMEVKEVGTNKYQLIVDHQNKLPFQLTVMDANRDVIHTESYQDMKGFTRIYDLSKFESENFTFELKGTTTRSVVSVQ